MNAKIQAAKAAYDAAYEATLNPAVSADARADARAAYSAAHDAYEAALAEAGQRRRQVADEMRGIWNQFAPTAR